jgi:hypothetical protein
MSVLPSRTALAVALAIALSAGANAAIAAHTIAAAQPSEQAIEAARANPHQLILQAGVFDPVTQQLDVSGVGAASAATLSSYVIIQFEARQLGARKALAARGVQFLGYVPNNAYYARLNGVDLASLKQAPGVRWVDRLQPAMKLAPQLWSSRRLDSAARQHDGNYTVTIRSFDGVPSGLVATALQKLVPGVVIVARSERADTAQYVRAEVAPADLDRLLSSASAIEGVSYIEPWVQPRPMNSGAIGTIQGDSNASCGGSGTVCGPTPIWDHGLFGSGQIIAISDTGTDANEAWFTTLDKGTGPHTAITVADDPAPVLPAIGTEYPDNKILAYWVQPGATAYDNNATCPNGNGSSSSWHGTHTSGTLVGDAAGTFGANTYLASTPTAANHELADGMAPNAQLIQQDIGNDDTGCLQINDLRGTLEQALAGGAHIHSDSWGAPAAGAYGSNDADVDYVANKLEDLLVVFSAGNDGPGATTIGSPGNAKNALTVGALGHAGSVAVAGFSSRGPTADGRTKPDIMAPGSSTISAAGDSNTTGTVEAPLTKPLSGTSMAAPTVAGNAVLMRQFFADGFYPRGSKTAADAYNPSGMAMKAMLLNGTDVLQPTNWPNNNIGWGREWLDGNLWFASTMAGGDDTRRTRLFERTNAAGLETGGVDEYTIANVPAGTEFRVTLTWFDPEGSPGAATSLVNNLDLEVVGPGSTTYLGNHFTGGVSTVGGSADTANTVEQVRLTAPVAGAYTLRVKGTAVPGSGREETDRQGYALVASGGFGLPDTAALSAPSALTIAGNDASGIAVGFTAASGAQGFQLYRANGTCASANAGDFRLVATGAASPLLDARGQGGFSYAYKVRGVQNDVEGDVSSCIDAVSAAACSLQPVYSAGTVAIDGSNASCSVALTWPSADAFCPTSTGVTYDVVRDTDPYFSSAQTVASGIATTSYTDSAVVNGTPYYYRVVARDSFGNPSNPTAIASVTPSGVDGPDPAAFLDNVDTHTYLSKESPWQITNTAASDGTLSYHSALDNLFYPANTCSSVETPSLTIMPGASTLNFMARYDVEYQWDGVAMEISTDDGANWTDLAPEGGYPSDFSQTGSPPGNACGYAASHGAFNGVSTAASNADPGNGTATPVFKPFSADLSSHVGQPVRIRWRFSSDGGAEFAGFWLDQIQLGDSAALDLVFRNGFESVAAGGDYMCH